MKSCTFSTILLFLVISTQSYMTAYPPITTSDLVNYASKGLKTAYLQQFQGKVEREYEGIVFGSSTQLLVSIPVRLRLKACPTYINVIFLVDTSFPITTLKTETLNKLYQNCPQVKRSYSSFQAVVIAGYQLIVQESQFQSQTMNVLGSRFMLDANSHLQVDYSNSGSGSFKLVLQGSKLKELQDEQL